MTRDEITSKIIRIFREHFEMENPGRDDDLRDTHEFDSIDAIELLRDIEIMLGSELSQAEKKNAMEIRTINDILDYIELLSAARAKGPAIPN